jgi:endonuclease/exonuclease/phosphatase family metal-dependent hydrolase
LKSLITKIILLANGIVAFLLVLTYLSVYVNPSASWVFAFIGMAYPFILLFNILFLILWIFLRKWYFLLSLLCIAAGWNTLTRFFQFQPKVTKQTHAETSIRLVTYNVRLFNYYQWHKDTATWRKIVDYIHAENPDIVCFQEFITLPGTGHDLKDLIRKLTPLRYYHVFYTDRVPGKINFGMATFSKYPIIHKEKIVFRNSLNGSICSDIAVGHDTIRVYNCHLQSLRLRKEYNDLLDSLIFHYSEKQLEALKDVSVHLRQAFVQRAGQVNILSRNIRISPFPVIVCGDFNDTPVSYTYHKMRDGLQDAFMEAGSGLGNTFQGNLPFVRIDYVFYSPVFHARFYQTKKIDWSDHFPLTVGFIMQEKEDSKGQNSHPII